MLDALAATYLGVCVAMNALAGLFADNGLVHILDNPDIPRSDGLVLPALVHGHFGIRSGDHGDDIPCPARELLTASDVLRKPPNDPSDNHLRIASLSRAVSPCATTGDLHWRMARLPRLDHFLRFGAWQSSKIGGADLRLDDWPDRE